MRKVGSHLSGFRDRGVKQTLVAGIGYRWQGDLSFGLAVSDELARQDLPPHVSVSDLGYGALYAAQDIGEIDPPCERLVLVTATVRDRDPGCLYEFLWDGISPGDEEIQARIREAGAGVIHVDHLLVVGTYLNTLPSEVLVLEVEPTDLHQGELLSPAVGALLPAAVHAIRTALVPQYAVVRSNGTTNYGIG